MNASPERTAEAPAEIFDFEGIFSNHYARVVRVIVRIVNDSGRAEDLAMEVFWKLLRRPPRKTIDPGGWLYRTAVRAGLDELRRQTRRRKYESILHPAERKNTPEDLHEESQRRQRVRNVLAVMNRRQVELLLLRSDDMSYEEVGHLLGLSPTSIGTLLRRAQQAFRKEYVKRYGQEH